MMIKSVKKFNNLFVIGSMVVAAGLMACNSSDYGNSKTDATTDSVNTANTAAAETADKPVAKVRKGRASVSMTSSDNANDNAASVKKTSVAKADKDGVYSMADVMPAYPGGDPALQQFVESNVTYPQSAMDGNVEGTVRVSFVVDEKGTVTKPQIQGNTNPGSGLDQEALRVVQQMPKWTPGTVKGKPVKTRLELPITFKLSET